MILNKIKLVTRRWLVRPDEFGRRSLATKNFVCLVSCCMTKVIPGKFPLFNFRRIGCKVHVALDNLFYLHRKSKVVQLSFRRFVVVKSNLRFDTECHFRYFITFGMILATVLSAESPRRREKCRTGSVWNGELSPNEV